ncbi:hypothetical protein F3Y22_tig00111402pilonHSYRG00242 [Hibiscus syriacus]|uniref:Phytocyanin domain-containing protein n=1 Tax=Hibiscus syriacus TaxID=106335 RepID=A0A6A2XT36_HIBSY|nr:hypothetical protein F3Y22_tig00111402pilonHSYRG00242 [Hibiscus syriacus]
MVIPTGNDDFYDDWADNKNFAVGDVLVFNFSTGQHNVEEVTEADYDSCNAANAVRSGTPRLSPTTPGAPSPSGRTYTVGDSTGWRVPAGNDDLYDDWNDNKDFFVGDVILFNFTTGQHDVLEVTEADYDACNAANSISNVTTGPARITLNRTGDHYFICGFPGHCTAGQKLNVEVRNGNRTGTAPTPRPSPTTPATPSGRTFSVGDSIGWIVPTGNDDFYDDWNDNKDFYVGDVLRESLSSKSNFSKLLNWIISTANPILTVSNGRARIILNRTGDHYFICGFPGHCTAGKKLSIEVENGNRPGTTPTTPGAPTPIVPGTPSASAPGTSSGVTAGPTSPATPGTSSASSLVATLSTCFSMSIALALLW